MELDITDDRIKFEKELNDLDKLVIDFISILNKLNINYVIISGYVAILFGRNRASEDVDLFIEKIDFDKFKELWGALIERFECLNSNNVKTVYDDYINKNIAIRFANPASYIPNVEIKFPKIDLDVWSLENKKEVMMNGHRLYISPIELQIVFKLSLGSEKDLEDARYLYKIFKSYIDKKVLEEWYRKLNIKKEYKDYIT